jgi:hypothetical protein
MPNDNYKVDEPVNVQERYLYAMVLRLDALCNMVSSLVEHIASKENIAVENNTVIEKPKPARKKRTEE